MNIGVAIVTYNSAEDIIPCLQSVVSEGIRDISVVDSVSCDDTVQKISELHIPVRVLNSNKGFGYAANKAALALNTEYVLFLNPDAVLVPGSIASLRKTMSEHPDAGIIGMLLCDASGKEEHMAYGYEPNLIQMIARHIYQRKNIHIPERVDWVSGGALCMKKGLFDSLKGFDDGFFLYWEDVDICRRAREKGFQVLIDPTSQVLHKKGGSNVGSVETRDIYDKSADRYFKKHYATPIWKLQRFLRKLYRLYSVFF